LIDSFPEVNRAELTGSRRDSKANINNFLRFTALAQKIRTAKVSIKRKYALIF